MDPISLIEALAEFSREIASNPLVDPYIKIISTKENKKCYSM